MYEFGLTNVERHRVRVAPYRRDPNTGTKIPVSVDGAVSGVASDGNHTVEPGADPFELLITPLDGYVGEIRGVGSVDADRGPGVRTISFEYVGQVSDAEATDMDVSGANEPKPAPPTPTP